MTASKRPSRPRRKRPFRKMQLGLIALGLIGATLLATGFVFRQPLREAWLLEQLETETDPATARSIVRELAELRSSGALPRILRRIARSEEDPAALSQELASALKGSVVLGGESESPTVGDTEDDESWNPVAEIRWMVESLSPDSASLVQVYRELLEDADPRIRIAGLRLFAGLFVVEADSGPENDLESRSEDGQSELRLVLEFTDILPALQDANASVRELAVETLCDQQLPRARDLEALIVPFLHLTREDQQRLLLALFENDDVYSQDQYDNTADRAASDELTPLAVEQLVQRITAAVVSGVVEESRPALAALCALAENDELPNTLLLGSDTFEQLAALLTRPEDDLAQAVLETWPTLVTRLPERSARTAFDSLLAARDRHRDEAWRRGILRALHAWPARGFWLSPADVEWLLGIVRGPQVSESLLALTLLSRHSTYCVLSEAVEEDLRAVVHALDGQAAVDASLVRQIDGIHRELPPRLGLWLTQLGYPPSSDDAVPSRAARLRSRPDDTWPEIRRQLVDARTQGAWWTLTRKAYKLAASTPESLEKCDEIVLRHLRYSDSDSSFFPTDATVAGAIIARCEIAPPDDSAWVEALRQRLHYRIARLDDPAWPDPEFSERRFRGVEHNYEEREPHEPSLADAAAALGSKARSLQPLLVELHQHPRQRNSSRLTVGIARLGVGIDRSPEYAVYRNWNPREPLESLEALGECGPDSLGEIPAVLQFLEENEDPAVVRAAAEFFGRLASDPERCVPALAKWLAHERVDVRIVAARALARYDERAADATEALGQALSDGDARVRFEAARALRNIGGAARSALDALRQLESDTNERVREFAARAIETIEGN